MDTYEKKYKEALERARQFSEKLYLEDSKGIVDYIFPELKESEDEQHRKWILEYLYDGLQKSDEQFKDQFKCAIAWFEKQGEHANFLNKIKIGDKVTRNKDGVLVNLSQLKRIAKPAENKGKHNMGISETTKKKLEDNLNKALEKETPESCNEFLKKQGEQKHVFDVEIPFGTDSELVEETITIPDGCYAIIEDNKVILRKGEQKSAEWTHKDGKKLAKLWEILSVHRNTNSQVDNLMKWVKDLVSYKRQEWSEEDESHIRYLIECLEHCKKGVALTMTTSTSQEYIDWLKSLRPQSQWKPSDEQMEALWNVYQGGKEQAELATLYNDLKKLREE